MEMANGDLMENFNEANIEEIRSVIERERTHGPVIEKAYTMVQVNSACDVEVTKESRRICADALLR